MCGTSGVALAGWQWWSDEWANAEAVGHRHATPHARTCAQTVALCAVCRARLADGLQHTHTHTHTHTHMQTHKRAPPIHAALTRARVFAQGALDEALPPGSITAKYGTGAGAAVTGGLEPAFWSGGEARRDFDMLDMVQREVARQVGGGPDMWGRRRGKGGAWVF